MKRGLLAALALAVFAGALLADAAADHARTEEGERADWSATRALLDGIGARSAPIRASLLALDEIDADGLVVRSNGVAPTPAEVEAVSRFARRGGHVLVLAEPTVAARFGMEIVPARIHATDGGPLRGEGDPAPLLRAASPILGEGDVLLETVPETFVDADGDRRASAGDVAGPFPIARSALGGRVVVLSTPLLLDEEAMEDAATRDLLVSLLEERFPAGSLVALDETRARAPFDAGRALLAAAVHAGELPWLQGSGALAAVATAALAWPRKRAEEGGARNAVPLEDDLA